MTPYKLSKADSNINYYGIMSASPITFPPNDLVETRFFQYNPAEVNVLSGFTAGKWLGKNRNICLWNDLYSSIQKTTS